jgi:hypothetical protein
MDQIHLPGVEKNVFILMAEFGLHVNGGISGAVV